MFEHREMGDYGELVEFEKEDVEKWLKKAEEFLSVIDEFFEKGSGCGIR